MHHTFTIAYATHILPQAADALSKRFENRFAKLSPELELKSSRGGGSNRSPGGSTRGFNKGSKSSVDVAGPSDEERCRLARHLERARMEDVTTAVHEIDRRSPDALVLKGEAIEVDVDALDAWTFFAVERVVVPLAALRRTSRGGSARRRVRKKRPTSTGSSSSSTSSGSGSCSGRVSHPEGPGCGVDGEGACDAGGLATSVGRPYKKAKVEAV